MHQIAFTESEPVTNPFREDTKHQWIPSDVAVSECGHVKFLSYINNLHPIRHAPLYDSIASIFERFVPLFDRVLSCLADKKSPRQELKIPYSNRDEQMMLTSPHPKIPDRLPLQPTAKEAYTLRGKGIQVIVKIAEIHLTQNQLYDGSWHIEGTEAEQIVATGLYYFGCENMTESKLSFHVLVQEPYHWYNDDIGVAASYALEDNELLIQTLGAATAIEDRCLVFPNTLQHKVETIRLADTSKPGHRKVLAFFLVDPTKKIPSTSVIPPQQHRWLRESQHLVLRPLQQQYGIPDTVLSDHVLPFLPRGLYLKEAKRYRNQLMSERDSANDIEEDSELKFSLCEH
ncbi:hypothetical protein Poli38472_013539 [Pythium oligandrum]|uniref:DUF4246 domain-containing protein n=1 Tax=Pythium oligandrum TaxID=41045 RepID=A0A8K1FC91_PYTOL|nr:hypothetical protein Poli38472_013539 [Pythium oligandrum]|eukprot:TMW58065.1 hypothetical protein Poli38472_013539 [Pythium oligandrum]